MPYAALRKPEASQKDLGTKAFLGEALKHMTSAYNSGNFFWNHRSIPRDSVSVASPPYLTGRYKFSILDQRVCGRPNWTVTRNLKPLRRGLRLSTEPRALLRLAGEFR